MRIFAFHLLNDYSGSPKVLRQLAHGWAQNGYDVHMVTSSGREGFLSDIPHTTYHHFWYAFAANPILRAIFLMWSQVLICAKMYSKIKKTDIIYVNTVLPFGAGILGKIKGCQVIYHIHETSIKPWILKKFLFTVVKMVANKVIYVSQYLATQESLPLPTYVLYNAIDDTFVKEAFDNPNKSVRPTNILMICSLKWYKGVDVFVQLARRLADLSFRLVVNANEEEIASYFEGQVLPKNLTILPTQKNVHPQYQWADIVTNLSNPEGWIETFGLTAIEAMAYHIPVIVPSVGGIAEIIEEGKTGYKVDSRNLNNLIVVIEDLIADEAIYEILKTNAEQEIKKFNEKNFIDRNMQIILS
jgi:L-malate glycosyltransferase